MLRTFSKHYSTGEPIPEKLVEALQRAKKMFAATELQRQVVLDDKDYNDLFIFVFDIFKKIILTLFFVCYFTRFYMQWLTKNFLGKNLLGQRIQSRYLRI